MSSPDPAASLERRLTDFAASLPDDERSLLVSVLTAATLAPDEPEVAGFATDDDLLMLRMQSMMAQRSQMMSMLSNMLKQMSDTNSSIIRNLK